jgi:hypothetical protein
MGMRGIVGVRLALLGLLWTSPALRAQVVAEQGAAPQDDFHSPMVLTLPVRDLSMVPVNTMFKVEGVGAYWVDDAQIRSLAIRRDRDSHKVKVFGVEGSIFVRDSSDREIVIKLELLDESGAVRAVWTTPRFDAEERKISPFRMKGSIPTGSKPTRIRLTVTVYS